MPSRLVSVDSDTLYLPDEVRAALATYPELAAAIQSGARAQLPSFNIKHYGATGNGVSDDTAAIKAALAAAPFGGTVYLPQGQYKVSSPITVPPGVNLVGVSKYASTVMTTSSTGTVFVLGSASGLYRLKVTTASGTTRTGGYFVDMEGNSSTVSECDFSGYYIAITIATDPTAAPVVNTRILHSGFSNPATGTAGGGAIVAQSFAGGVIDDASIVGARLAAQSTFGIQLLHGDTIIVSNSNITATGRALYITPTGGLAVVAAEFVNCLFDSAYGTGVSCVQINPNNGFVYHTKFTGCWFGLSDTGNGCVMQFSNGGAVDGIQFTGCDFMTNGAYGLAAVGANVKNWVVSGCLFSGNKTAGVFAGTSTSEFVITGCRIGPSSASGVNGQAIVIDASACNGYLIANNSLRGNTTSGISDGGTGANKTVANNLL